MKKLLNKHSLFIFLGIFLLGFVLRTVYLDRAMPGVLNDEMKFFMNAKAVWLTGTSVTGGWNMFSLNGDPREFYDNEAVPAVMAPFVGPLPYSMYFVRFPFAVISALTVVL